MEQWRIQWRVFLRQRRSITQPEQNVNATTTKSTAESKTYKQLAYICNSTNSSGSEALAVFLWKGSSCWKTWPRAKILCSFIFENIAKARFIRVIIAKPWSSRKLRHNCAKILSTCMMWQNAYSASPALLYHTAAENLQIKPLAGEPH